MRVRHVATAALMTIRDLGRKRLMLALALSLPPVFFAVVLATIGDRTVPVRLAAAAATMIEVDQRRQALLFIGIAGAGLVSAFVAASLVQRNLDASRRLVLCGYQPAELLAARLLVQLGVVLIAGLYTWGLLAALATPAYPAAVALAIGLGAFVYGAYGFLVGAVFRRELESIFAILVLLNIDAGWLQNPIYYEEAGNRWLIESLPAHFPSQVAYVATFTADDVTVLVLRSAVYGLMLLAVALGVYTWRLGGRTRLGGK